MNIERYYLVDVYEWYCSLVSIVFSYCLKMYANNLNQQKCVCSESSIFFYYCAVPCNYKVNFGKVDNQQVQQTLETEIMFEVWLLCWVWNLAHYLRRESNSNLLTQSQMCKTMKAVVFWYLFCLVVLFVTYNTWKDNIGNAYTILCNIFMSFLYESSYACV